MEHQTEPVATSAGARPEYEPPTVTLPVPTLVIPTLAHEEPVPAPRPEPSHRQDSRRENHDRTERPAAPEPPTKQSATGNPLLPPTPSQERAGQRLPEWTSQSAQIGERAPWEALDRPTLPPPPDPRLGPPVASPSRRGPHPLLVGAGVLVAFVVLGVTAQGLRNPATDTSAPGATPTAGPGQPVYPPATYPTGPVQRTTAPPSATHPTNPADAQSLADADAGSELARKADESSRQVAGLVGTWVAQVSGKCVGVAADIGTDWFPDGTDDTARITVQQILGYHLAMGQRFGAVTVRPTQLGIPSDSATSGPCTGQPIWMSVVPRGYATPAEANAWCAANIAPVRECEARYVAPPGERSRAVTRY
ncbi:hypothetical protein AB0M43_35505 [Longispora sp. NPDC051575]|uniref:hypothetical protein n=1 Tax=Longispora sp. NPDC051575 TaxID=3154943 RepID=UPI0034477F17